MVFLLFVGFYLFVTAGAFLEYVTFVDPVRDRRPVATATKRRAA
jgi:hypothetical protein